MHNIAKTFIVAMLLKSVFPAFADTSLSQAPLGLLNVVEPNMIMGVDDSGSMDFEIMQATNDGAAWWNTTADKSGFTGWAYTNTNGTLADSYTSTTTSLNFNVAGDATSSWLKYAYLFPSPDRQNSEDTTKYAHFAIPPTDAYAYFRSSDYNPLYYNPNVTYTPWSTAYYSSNSQSFTDATPTAAKSYPTDTSGITWDLTSTYTNGDTNYTFHFVTGMTIPGASISGIKRGNTAITSDVIVGTTSGYTSSSHYEITVPYYLATYYVVDATCTDAAPVCVTAPDNKKLRRYEIKSGNTFPSHRSYTAEMQNFANWFTYYRKRRLMLASAMSSVLPQLTNLRTGLMFYGSRNTPTMFDLNSTIPSSNYQSLLGSLYNHTCNGCGTPARETLKAIGQIYASNTNSTIQYACQRNAAMLVTDGYANTASNLRPATYSTTPWFSAAPYQTIYSDTLADLAAYYFATTLASGSSFSAGLVPYDPAATAPGADKNPNLHMNTYGMTLGAKGLIYTGAQDQDEKYPYNHPPTWPNPSSNRSPTAVDDLYHATINGRGKMLRATDSSSTVTSLKSIISDLLNKAGAGSALTLSNVNIQSGDNTAYIGSFNQSNWFGDLVAAPINTTTGNVSVDNKSWSFQTKLDAKTWTNRLVASYNSSGVIFPSDLSATQTALLNTPATTDNANVANWILGDRSNEGSTYRTRTHVLGDIVNAEPVVVKHQITWSNISDTAYTTFATNIASRKSVVYQAANDGMLHAVDASDGNELWAYIPSFVLPKLNSLTSSTYSHTFTVDGTPTVADVKIDTTWKTLLVGGLRAGGKGYYALDITDPTAATAAAVASKVKWEFPNTSTSASITANVGFSYSKPLIVNTAAGWVVLVASGYNNGDYKGHLFALNPDTGEVRADINTNIGTSDNPAGLANLAGYSTDGSTVSKVYAGDLNGNVFRFDLSSADPAHWTVTRIATVTDAHGTAQPITSAPEVGQKNNLPMVYIGTGRYLDSSDISNSQTQSIYAFLDDGTIYDGQEPHSYPRTSGYLVRQTVTTGLGGTRTVSSNTVDYASKKGWWLDLPVGERMNVDMQLAYGTLVFNTNNPSITACSSNSYNYQINQNTGAMMNASYFAAGESAWAGRTITSSLSSRPVVAALPSGQVISLTHAADNTVNTANLLGKGSTSIRKVSWREIRR